MKRKNIFFGTFQYHFTHINIHTKRKRKQQQKRENQIEQGKQEKEDKQIIETPSTDLGSLLLLQLLRPSAASENSPMHPLQVLKMPLSLILLSHIVLKRSRQHLPLIRKRGNTSLPPLRY